MFMLIKMYYLIENEIAGMKGPIEEKWEGGWFNLSTGVRIVLIKMRV